MSVLGALAVVIAVAHDEPPAGFEALFNGHDLVGWWGAGTEDPREWGALPAEELAAKKAASMADIGEHWWVEDGVLINDGHGLFLTSEREFGDFELLVEYRTVAGADSGIYLKGCPQVQIWDTTEAGGKWKYDADKGSGGLWNNSPGAPGKDPLVHADRAFGEWNAFRIVQCGSRTWVWFNGELVVDGAIMENYFDKARELPIPPRGPIQLQTHGGEIRWRNIFVRDIPPAEANRWLRGEDDGPEFNPLFNGRDFTGWASAEGYEIVDGTIVGLPEKGSVLHTTRDYRDFIVRLEFKHPVQGNNGLAIRYPGHGISAYTGMCELQVLDDTAPRYADLDPRKYHGSAYGMVAAHRGYLRPVGEWNYQEVTVRGSTLRVELNGTVILDTDLADVTEFMDGQAHPGKDNATGAFGLSGHNSAVAFRNISLKELP